MLHQSTRRGAEVAESMLLDRMVRFTLIGLQALPAAVAMYGFVLLPPLPLEELGT
jgi:hypothetical protein